MAIADEAGGAADDDDDDDEYADMADFEDDNVMEDEAAAAADGGAASPSSGAATAVDSAACTPDDNLMRVRTYDLSITYDKYYQTPRVWMMGYDAGDSSKPLTGDEMMQDVMSDYANRTVTVETHPHVPGPHTSVHPCQHGAVMKTIVGNLIRAAEEKAAEAAGAGGGAAEVKPPSVEMYLFIFLKFVNSMIPTINYDFTMDVTASTQK
uniref:Autophagy-related protein 3 n=1 Tax=Odontella aurita TaxID=265563 RepID=A0A7S4N5H6_9STRA